MQSLALIEGHPVLNLRRVAAAAAGGVAGQRPRALLPCEREAAGLGLLAVGHASGHQITLHDQGAVLVEPHMLRREIHFHIRTGEIVGAFPREINRIAVVVGRIVDRLPGRVLPGLKILLNLRLLRLRRDRVAVLVVAVRDRDRQSARRAERTAGVPRVVLRGKLRHIIRHGIVIEDHIQAVVHRNPVHERVAVQRLRLGSEGVGDAGSLHLIEDLLLPHRQRLRVSFLLHLGLVAHRRHGRIDRIRDVHRNGIRDTSLADRPVDGLSHGLPELRVINHIALYAGFDHIGVLTPRRCKSHSLRPACAAA